MPPQQPHLQMMRQAGFDLVPRWKVPEFYGDPLNYTVFTSTTNTSKKKMLKRGGMTEVEIRLDVGFLLQTMYASGGN